MAGPTIHPDGAVTSSALSVDEHMNAHDSVYNHNSLELGQIEAIYAVDNQADRFQKDAGRNTLYDVRVIRTDGGTEIIRSCRMLQPGFGGGLNNFFEVLPTDPGFKGKDGSVTRDLKRGHTVLVGFIGGFRDNPVIVGTMPHPGKTAVGRRPKKSKGVFSEGEIQGLNFQIGNEGQLKIAFNGPRDDTGKIVGKDGPTTIEIDKTGNIKIATNAKQTVTIDRVAKKIRVENGPTYIDMDQNGDKIQVVAKTVEVGTGGLQPQVVGDDWKKIMEDLIDEITNIIVPTGVGPSGMPVNKGKFMAIKSKLKEALSKNHKVEK
jgi:hypothetical protein